MAKKRGRGFCTKASSCWIPGDAMVIVEDENYYEDGDSFAPRLQAAGYQVMPW